MQQVWNALLAGVEVVEESVEEAVDELLRSAALSAPDITQTLVYNAAEQVILYQIRKALHWEAIDKQVDKA